MFYINVYVNMAWKHPHVVYGNPHLESQNKNIQVVKRVGVMLHVVINYYIYLHYLYTINTTRWHYVIRLRHSISLMTSPSSDQI